MLVRVLLLLPRTAVAERFERLLRGDDVDVVRLVPTARLVEHLPDHDADVFVVSPEVLVPDPAGAIGAIRGLPDRPEIVLVVEREDPEERAAMLAAGCLAVLNHEVGDAVLQETLRAFVKRRRDEALERLKANRPEERYSLDDFVSSSAAMTRFVATARRVVRSDASLMILGETGVGKERLARAIHHEGRRAGGPFLAVNCGALSESLLESELFGHERGAFTGAVRARKGYFELAHGGTIFLDEIGEMPLHLQVKLLRVLEDRRVIRVGGERAVRIDARVMAATNRDLESARDAGRFRADLYYRLAVVTLFVPALRQRCEDIPALAREYVTHSARSTGRSVTGIDEAALEALKIYDWPGNVRELINVIERAVLLCGDNRIGLEDLPQRIAAGSSVARGDGATAWTPPSGLSELPLRAARNEVVRSFEREYVTDLLRATHGRVGEAARRAGVTPRAFYDLMLRHGIRKETFRPRRANVASRGDIRGS